MQKIKGAREAKTFSSPRIYSNATKHTKSHFSVLCAFSVLKTKKFINIDFRSFKTQRGFLYNFYYQPA